MGKPKEYWLSFPESKPRACLKCGETFPSTGPSNRICCGCSRDNKRVYEKVALKQTKSNKTGRFTE